jgi:hypothetical protein
MDASQFESGHGMVKQTPIIIYRLIRPSELFFVMNFQHFSPNVFGKNQCSVTILCFFKESHSKMMKV